MIVRSSGSQPVRVEQDVVQARAVCDLVLELGGLGLELLVGQRGVLVVERDYLVGDLGKALYGAPLTGTEQL